MNLEMKAVCKSYDQAVLKDITFSQDISSLAVIGPSGGGKSTLIRIIAGLLPPSSGEIYIDGRQLLFSPKELLAHRRGVGFVFQAKGLFHHLSGLENIVLPLVHVHGKSKAEAIQAARSLLDRFGLKADGHKLPHELSGGQQQRIAIARAIAPMPALLILDEPTSALDPELTADVLDMLDELKNDHFNMIVVTHEMGFAKKACKDALFLVDGKLVEQGECKRLFSAPKTPELNGFLNKILHWETS